MFCSTGSDLQMYVLTLMNGIHSQQTVSITADLIVVKCIIILEWCNLHTPVKSWQEACILPTDLAYDMLCINKAFQSGFMTIQHKIFCTYFIETL